MAFAVHDDTIWLKRVEKQREALIAEPVPRVGLPTVLPSVPLISRTLSGVSKERPKHKRQPIFEDRAPSASVTSFASDSSDWAPPSSPVALSSRWTDDLSVEGSEVLPASAPQPLLSPPKLVGSTSTSVFRPTREPIPEIQARIQGLKLARSASAVEAAAKKASVKQGKVLMRRFAGLHQRGYVDAVAQKRADDLNASIEHADALRETTRARKAKIRARLKREMKQRQQISGFNRIVTTALLAKANELAAAEVARTRVALPQLAHGSFRPQLSLATPSVQTLLALGDFDEYDDDESEYLEDAGVGALSGSMLLTRSQVAPVLTGR